jgi:hypothetical protein
MRLKRIGISRGRRGMSILDSHVSGGCIEGSTATALGVDIKGGREVLTSNNLRGVLILNLHPPAHARTPVLLRNRLQRLQPCLLCLASTQISPWNEAENADFGNRVGHDEVLYGCEVIVAKLSGCKYDTVSTATAPVLYIQHCESVESARAPAEFSMIPWKIPAMSDQCVRSAFKLSR